jgi:hypothetical protein
MARFAEDGIGLGADGVVFGLGNVTSIELLLGAPERVLRMGSVIDGIAAVRAGE